MPEKGYAVYKELLAINPDDVRALNNLACLCADGFQPPKVDEGLELVRHAISLLGKRGISDPTIDDTYGWLLVLGGQTSDGIDVLRRAIDRQPLIIGYYHLGEGYLRMKRPEDAQRQVNLALEAIAKAQASNQPVDPVARAKIADLSNRVLDSLRVRTSGSVP
jgi:tetratricopeptide (TPR) repeat protein